MERYLLTGDQVIAFANLLSLFCGLLQKSAQEEERNLSEAGCLFNSFLE